MKRFNKIYLEISNICNLSCAFCPGTKREPRSLSAEEFSFFLRKIKPYTDYVYFHLMGEPLLHPLLSDFLDIAKEEGLKVILTTNGTLLFENCDMLLSKDALHKINVSLHAFEANDLAVLFNEYLDECFKFGQAAEGKKLVVYRLWNQGGADAKNEQILSSIEHYFPKPWTENWKGARLCDKIYLEYGDKFDWPDMDAEVTDGAFSCRGLFDQIGVLSDGRVVPCCLDHEGDITLGNLFSDELDMILESDRVKAIIDGFKKGIAAEALCQRCGYAKKKFG